MLLIFAGALGLAAVPAARGPSPPDYFPDAFATPTFSCSIGDRRRNRAVLERFENQQYTSHLAAAQEPSLLPAVAAAKRGAIRTVRFTWLRSFHAPVIVRVEWTQGLPTLTATVLTGAGADKPGRIDRTMTRRLTAIEASGLGRMLTSPRVLAAPPRYCWGGIELDGAEWIVEGVDRSGYHFGVRTSPQSGPFRVFGLTMLRLTGWQFGEVY